MKKIFALVLLLSISVHTKANFDFNANCVEAYKAIVSLRLEHGKALIEKKNVSVRPMQYLRCSKITWISILFSLQKAMLILIA